MTSKTYPAFPHPEPKAIIIFCGDPRFLVATNSFITEELGFKEGEYLPLSLPGGISSLSEPFASPRTSRSSRKACSSTSSTWPRSRK